MNDTQIHCLLDCLAAGMRRAGGPDAADVRPVYTGVWNSPFAADGNGFSYYSEEIDPDADLRLFEQLYGSCLRRWQEPHWSREEKIAALLREEAGRHPGETIIILVDLFHLPSSAVFFGIKHFPHMVIVQKSATRPNKWQVIDPFFEWEGEVEEATLLAAFGCDGLSAGLTLDTRLLREPGEDEVAEAFRGQISLEPGSLIAGVEQFLTRLADGTPGYSAETLFGTIGQVGVVAKRWKGYGMLARYFAERCDGDPGETVGSLEQLLVRWESFVLAIVRLGVLGAPERLKDAHAKLRDLRRLEADVQGGLLKLFGRWEVSRHAARA